MQARKSSGVPIESVAPGSPAYKSGIRKGDILVSINGHPVSDLIDYMFYKDEPELVMSLLRNGDGYNVCLRGGVAPLGLIPAHFRTRTCGNKCIFCFVLQLPKGLRRTLYVKDEDYRMSFLYGNYITMSNMSAEDMERIASQRLSPLYISVHSTDLSVRRKLLGNPKAPDIMKELRYLADNRIRMHVQIVLCPGINDGVELEKTLNDLASLYPQLLSIAVVPVGLTAHRKMPLKPVGRRDAESAVETVESFQKKFSKAYGDRIVYGADELYIKAGLPFPPLRTYGDLPQIENGVGMVPLFMAEAKKIKSPNFIKSPNHAPLEKELPHHPPLEKGGRGDLKRYLTITGASFYPYLKDFIEKSGLPVTPIKVKNDFFGNSVTVTGLLTGQDVIRQVKSFLRKHQKSSYDALLIPDCVLREGGEVFLDDVTVKDIEKALGIKAVVVESTPKGLANGISLNANIN